MEQAVLPPPHCSRSSASPSWKRLTPGGPSCPEKERRWEAVGGLTITTSPVGPISGFTQFTRASGSIAGGRQQNVILIVHALAAQAGAHRQGLETAGSESGSYLLWEQGAGGSNPLTPTILTPRAELVRTFFGRFRLVSGRTLVRDRLDLTTTCR